MASFNRVILLGNLTRDTECRYIPSGTAVADIGIAVNDRRKSPTGEWFDEVTFVDVTLWGRQAEIAGEFLSKGSPVLIEGRLKLDTWESEGQKRSKLKVIGERIHLLGRNADSSGGGSSSFSRGSSAPQNNVPASGGGDHYGGGNGDGGSGDGEDIPF